MPGIAGIISPRIDEQHRLELMLDSMMHQGFYTRVQHIDNPRGWFVGGTAIKNSYSDCLPIGDAGGEVFMFLGGECLSHSEASSIIDLYDRDGPEFVKQLNGWFSGILLDKRAERVVLFNDRYGIHRIYYYEGEEGLYAASEAKALLRAFPELRAIDPQSIAEYFCFDCVLNDRSYFPKINMLPAASLWIFEKRHVEKKQYFTPQELENQKPMKLEAYYEALNETFKRVVPRHISGDSVAMALTGGLDTRLLMSCLPGNAHRLRAFTFGGIYRDSMDVKIARKVSRECGIPHRVLRLSQQFLRDYPDEVERAIFVSDGMADATTADMVHMTGLVREIGRVMVTGKFGSQVFGRVRRALRARIPEPGLVHHEFQPLVESVSDALRPYAHENNLSYVLHREIPWYWSRFSVPEMTQIGVRSPFLDNDLIALLYRAPAESFKGSDFELRAIAKNRPELLRYRTNLGMAGHSPALISPLIAAIYRFRHLSDKVLNWDVLPYSLHHVVARVDAFFLSPLGLDRLFLGSEFFRHYALWFRRELSGYLREILLSERTLSRPYWNRGYLEKIVKMHIFGTGRCLSEIRKVLTIELIHRTLIESDGSRYTQHFITP